MPVNEKNTDAVYSYTNESGKTVYSNTKKEMNIKVPPIYAPPLPKQNPEKEIKSQIIQPPIIKPVRLTDNSGLRNIFGTLVIMIIAVMAFRLFLDNLEKKLHEKKRQQKIKDLQPEPKIAKPQTVIHNHYHTTIVTTQAETKQNIPPLTQLIAEKNKAQYAEQQIIDVDFTEVPQATTARSTPYWTIDFIRSLEWREFEKLCARILEEKGFLAQLGDFGPGGDGGKDIKIYKQQCLDRPYALAQCKAQKDNIKVGKIRELRGTMAKENVTKGYFFTSSGFYKKAWEEGTEQKMELVSGDELLAEIKNLPQYKQKEMLLEIINTDYMTPTCSACGIKMVKKSTTKSDYQFWGCIKYPRCKNKLELRWTDT